MDTEVQEPPVGASVWEADLYRLLTTHIAKERGMLEEYAAAAKTTGSHALEYLVDLLIEDEKRHHRVFAELASSLKSESELAAEQPVVPRLDFSRRNAEAVLDASGRLLDNERDDLHELKSLKKTLRDVEDTTLWSVLVDVMIRDTEKHIALLTFVEKQAKRKRH
jgi:rubrerythrin